MRKGKREEHSGKAGKLAPVLGEWVHTSQKSGLQDKPSDMYKSNSSKDVTNNINRTSGDSRG